MKKLLFIASILCSMVLFGQEKTSITPMDLAKMKMVVSATASPDGSKIAYRVWNQADPLVENASASYYLHLYDVKSENSVSFVTQHSVSNVAFRPGANAITFTARKKGDQATSLYEISLSGGEAQKIFEFSSSIADYHWHADGQQLAFVARLKKEEPASSGLPYEPEVYEENLATSAAYIVHLSDGEVKKVKLDGHVSHAKWSPDGTMLAISAAPSSLVDDYYTSQKIFFVSSETLEVSGYVDHKAKLGDFSWSPDGKKVAFIGGEDQHDPIAGRLLIADSKGGKAEVIQRDFKGSFDAINWKDRSSLYFLASEGVYTSFGTIDLKGKMNKTLDKESLTIASFSRGKGLTALVASTDMHPNELFILNDGDKNPTRKTVSNDWLKDRLMGKQEVITYKASDGMEIEGLYIEPVNSSGKKPMITIVHGGPEAHYNNGWNTFYSVPGQLAAGQGYAVFYPNYRGSTGRGLEFAKSSQADPAGKEFDDIIDGIDYLIKNKNIDKDKVGVTGGSYGGYATAWMSTRHTERFAAGVMFVGISNNLSKWGTSDIPEEMFLVHSRKRIWEDYQFFLERSPIYYAGQAKTPLLIMAGKEDTRVDPGQSYELYRHIKTRTETPVRLVLYPGEGHGNRKSTARFDYSLRLMRWFDTYLKNESGKIPETTLQLESGEK